MMIAVLSWTAAAGFAFRAWESTGFDRTTGVNVLLEEISIAPELWARAPRYVSIALTNACELKCPFCYAPKTPARLEARQTLSWVEELDDAGGA